MTTQGPIEETEDERIRRLIDQRLQEVTGQPISVSLPGDPDHDIDASELLDEIGIKAILDGIDPRDSESAIELFNWLVDNARLHKIATMTEGGYMFIYQEPKGASKEGWTAGGTQGDRIVDDALAQAKASNQALKGLCQHCFSAIQQSEDDPSPVAETPRGGTDAKVCLKSPTKMHEFAG